jgi:hypothetical protein
MTDRYRQGAVTTSPKRRDNATVRPALRRRLICKHNNVQDEQRKGAQAA